MLAQSVVAEYGGDARFVVENYGDSELARRFGVTRYPAIFVDDVLVATPKDFGFYGRAEGKGDGRYAPIRSAQSHDRLRADLSRMIDAILAGGEAVSPTQPVAQGIDPARLPRITLRTLDGKRVTRSSLAGRPVLVEFWATWCPPCHSTLGWLAELKRRHGNRLTVVTVAIESDEAKVREIAAEYDVPISWAMGSPEVARAFGDISAVPTLFLFDARGRAVAAHFGAPPGLHAEVESQLGALGMN